MNSCRFATLGEVFSTTEPVRCASRTMATLKGQGGACIGDGSITKPFGRQRVGDTVAATENHKEVKLRRDSDELGLIKLP